LTAIIGVLCRDGVVIGTDSSTTFTQGQFRTIEQPTEKIEIIGEKVIIAGTGSVGLDQRFCSVVRNAWEGGLFTNDEQSIATTLSRLMIENMRSTHLNQCQYGAFIAFPASEIFHLCEFAVSDFQPEFKPPKMWYGSMGSTQPITDPFLAFIRDIFWVTGSPSVQDAIFAVTWTLEHAILVNPGGVNAPARVSVLERNENNDFVARILEDKELDEHRQIIEEAKDRLRGLREEHQPSAEEAAPNLPEP